MDFLQSYNGSIQAVAAVLNLFLIGALTFYSHRLQKKNYSIELYSRLQQEIKDCIGEINECIKYFTIQEHKTSLYLHELHNKKDERNLFMNIDIRKSIINNFKNNSKNDIKEAIISSMNENDEITLPGLGVFFEILWKNSDEEHQDYILNIIESNLKGD